MSAARASFTASFAAIAALNSLAFLLSLFLVPETLSPRAREEFLENDRAFMNPVRIFVKLFRPSVLGPHALSLLSGAFCLLYATYLGEPYFIIIIIIFIFCLLESVCVCVCARVTRLCVFCVCARHALLWFFFCVCVRARVCTEKRKL